jgi:hypothetical protein
MDEECYLLGYPLEVHRLFRGTCCVHLTYLLTYLVTELSPS